MSTTDKVAAASEDCTITSAVLPALIKRGEKKTMAFSKASSMTWNG